MGRKIERAAALAATGVLGLVTAAAAATPAEAKGGGARPGGSTSSSSSSTTAKKPSTLTKTPSSTKTTTSTKTKPPKIKVKHKDHEDLDLEDLGSVAPPTSTSGQSSTNQGPADLPAQSTDEFDESRRFGELLLGGATAAYLATGSLLLLRRRRQSGDEGGLASPSFVVKVTPNQVRATVPLQRWATTSSRLLNELALPDQRRLRNQLGSRFEALVPRLEKLADGKDSVEAIAEAVEPLVSALTRHDESGASSKALAEALAAGDVQGYLASFRDLLSPKA